MPLTASGTCYTCERRFVEETLTDDYRFSRAIAAAAVRWGRGRGYTFQP
ncbi:hypothetical protein ACFRCG_26935 [Embleya sp. NPDC056575]